MAEEVNMDTNAATVGAGDRTDGETFEETAYTVAGVETNRRRQKAKNKTRRLLKKVRTLCQV